MGSRKNTSNSTITGTVSDKVPTRSPRCRDPVCSSTSIAGAAAVTLVATRPSPLGAEGPRRRWAARAPVVLGGLDRFPGLGVLLPVRQRSLEPRARRFEGAGIVEAEGRDQVLVLDQIE